MAWRGTAIGDFRVGEPIADWAYITPDYPNGITRAELQQIQPIERAEVAARWFEFNYRPINIKSINEMNLDGILKERPPSVPRDGIFLDPLEPFRDLHEEFRGIIPDELILNLTVSLGQISDVWVPIQPIRMPNTVEETVAGLRIELERLQDRVRHLESLRGGIGHNQGPAIIDPAITNGAEEVASEIRQAIVGATPDKSRVEQAAGRIVKLRDETFKAAYQQGVKEVIHSNWPDISEALASVGHHLIAVWEWAQHLLTLLG